MGTRRLRTLWLSQAQTAQLFEKESDTIGLHWKIIYEEGELEEGATTEESPVVRQEGKPLTPGIVRDTRP